MPPKMKFASEMYHPNGMITFFRCLPQNFRPFIFFSSLPLIAFDLGVPSCVF